MQLIEFIEFRIEFRKTEKAVIWPFLIFNSFKNKIKRAITTFLA